MANINKEQYTLFQNLEANSDFLGITWEVFNLISHAAENADSLEINENSKDAQNLLKGFGSKVKLQSIINKDSFDIGFYVGGTDGVKRSQFQSYLDSCKVMQKDFNNFVKAFFCVCAYANDIDKKEFHVSLSSLMKYGYNSKRGRNMPDYEQSKKFVQMLEVISNIEFYFENKKEKVSRVFRLLNISYKKLENSSFPHEFKVKIFDGLDDLHNAAKIPKSCLKVDTHGNKFKLGVFILRCLASKGVGGIGKANITFSQMSKFVEGKTLSANERNKRILNMLNAIKEPFNFKVEMEGDGKETVYYFSSEIYKHEKQGK